MKISKKFTSIFLAGLLSASVAFSTPAVFATGDPENPVDFKWNIDINEAAKDNVPANIPICKATTKMYAINCPFPHRISYIPDKSVFSKSCVHGSCSRKYTTNKNVPKTIVIMEDI